MKIPDVNVLVHAHNASAREHDPCRRWLEESLSGPEAVGLLWVVVIGFIRISTSARIFPDPMTSAQAIGIARDWLEQPTVSLVAPGTRHLEIVETLLDRVGTGGDLTTDAHIAAAAIEIGATVVSCDTDFLRFTDLRVLDPTR